MKILFWGHQWNYPVPYFRGGQFAPYWEALGIEARYCALPLSREGQVPLYWLAHPAEARQLIEVAMASLDWADVVIFRRWYLDDVSEPAWDLASDKVRVYDTDDWDLNTRSEIPGSESIREARPLIERMAREADLVTVATPRLAQHYGRYSRRPPVVIRNAVDMALYEPDEPRIDDRPTALFYGSNGRLRDYFGGPDARGKWRGGYAHAAVRDADLRSIWLGNESRTHEPLEFDEVLPYQREMTGFFRSLGNSHADVGLAPLVGDGFDECKSELHWLEMAAAGIPVVAERLMNGPYGVVRDGTDGLLARGAQEWHDAVKRLAREPALRTDVVSAARSRLRTDYDPAHRAAEWAEVFAA
jgi:glycosyltransferase involved in cell wall biosynthesis